MVDRRKGQIVIKRDDCNAPCLPTENYKSRLPRIVDTIVEGCHDDQTIDHIDPVRYPSLESVIELITDLRDLLYPGYFGNQGIDHNSLSYYIGSEVDMIYDKFAHQITRAIRHECLRTEETVCTHCVKRGEAETVSFLEKIPRIRRLLAGDVWAAYKGDPAAKSVDEIVFSYPAIMAITTYRIAHELYIQYIPLLPRMMTEYAHGVTGIDIHPGAMIGEDFFIDHGTGVVIGETTTIGNNVRIYQGVTLGAHSFQKEPDGSLRRGYKRHPTIKDNVIIYSGATILGGETIIGEGSIIGGNVWLTHSIPPETHVTIEEPHLRIMTPKKEEHGR